MTTLELSRNKLTDLSSKIRSMKSLKTLKLEQNKLTKLTPEISSLTKLATITLGDNRLGPGALRDIPVSPEGRLTKLSAPRNLLSSSVFDDISRASSLLVSC